MLCHIAFGKHLLGIVLVCTGIAMVVFPGQGILTLRIGLMLINCPDKWAKGHQPGLQLPTSALPSPSDKEEW